MLFPASSCQSTHLICSSGGGGYNHQRCCKDERCPMPMHMHLAAGVYPRLCAGNGAESRSLQVYELAFMAVPKRFVTPAAPWPSVDSNLSGKTARGCRGVGRPETVASSPNNNRWRGPAAQGFSLAPRLHVVGPLRRSARGCPSAAQIGKAAMTKVAALWVSPPHLAGGKECGGRSQEA